MSEQQPTVFKVPQSPFTIGVGEYQDGTYQVSLRYGRDNTSREIVLARGLRDYREVKLVSDVAFACLGHSENAQVTLTEAQRFSLERIFASLEVKRD